jgi:hypothetical protein
METLRGSNHYTCQGKAKMGHGCTPMDADESPFDFLIRVHRRVSAALKGFLTVTRSKSQHRLAERFVIYISKVLSEPW